MRLDKDGYHLKGFQREETEIAENSIELEDS
jgi:hypothetical protein